MSFAEAKMVICGGGHVAQQVVKLAKLCDFTVIVFEDRQEFADQAYQAGADEVRIGDFERLLADHESDDDTFFVVLTRGHKFDTDCVRRAIGKPHAYLGMIGSKRKVGFVHDALIADGVSETEWEGVHAPIGLKIHAETPEEIAVAILAEIISIKNTNGHDYGMSRAVLDALRHIQSETDTGNPALLATITQKKGSAPRGVGARMIVYADGSITGTIGGGKGEADVIAEAVRFLKEDTGIRKKEITVIMTSDAAAADGLVCGGEITVEMERL